MREIHLLQSSPQVLPNRVDLRDPLRLYEPFPLRAVFYPFGFALEIVTNSQRVLSAAAASWGKWEKGDTSSPLLLTVGVAREGGQRIFFAPPVMRAQGNLISMTVDAHNSLCCDLQSGTAFGWITEALASDTLYFRYHLLEGLVLTMISASRAAPVHAACVSFNQRGFLLYGDSGAGKSSLACACALAGWTYTSDDASYIHKTGDTARVIGNSGLIRFRPSARALFPDVLVGREMTPRAGGKPSIEVPTEEIDGFIADSVATADTLLFLRRELPGTPARLSEVSEESAAEALIPELPLIPDPHGIHQALGPYLLGLERYALHYSDLQTAIQLLTTLAE